MTTLADRAELQKARNARHEALREQIGNNICRTCDGYPNVAWMQGDWVIRCNCWPKPPLLVNEYERTIGRRQWDMTERALATLDERGIKAVNAEVMAQEVRALLPGSTKATDSEIRLFVRFCLSLGANPFVREAYLIKYQEGQPASIVLGLRWKLKQAAKNAAYQGYKAGLVIQGEGPLEYREGALALPGEKVVGGWCEVHRQGWTVAPRHAVSMTEYFAGGRQFKNLWDTKPSTMIMKVAISQAIERAFPEEASETERQVAAVGVQVLDEGAAGVDLEDAPKALTEPAPAFAQANPGPGQENQAPPEPQHKAPPPPRRAGQAASDEFWPKQRATYPDMDSFTALSYLGVKSFTEWKGTVDEALARIAEKVPAKAG